MSLQVLLHDVLYSPVVAVIGIAAVVALIFIPLALLRAGLNPAEIAELLKETRQFVLDLIAEIQKRDS